ncbi:MAG: hypothetical protein E7566_01385 [Ruminococcaceae bacterium]|nr:hypothetical protein [Oscillospiraceae bacterium]
MKKLICIVLLMLILCVFTSCGSDSGNSSIDNNINKEGINTDTKFESDPKEVFKSFVESWYACDMDTAHDMLYGDYDYDKGINLFFDSLDDIHGAGSIESATENMKERYSTTDFKTAYKTYLLSIFGGQSLELHIDNTTLISTETVSNNDMADVISEFNDNISDGCYDFFESYGEMRNDYCDYMNTVIDSMYIDINDVEEMVQCSYSIDYSAEYDSIEMYIAKINGGWYPIVHGRITDYEHFGLYLI